MNVHCLIELPRYSKLNSYIYVLIIIIIFNIMFTRNHQKLQSGFSFIKMIKILNNLISFNYIYKIFSILVNANYYVN